MRTKTEVLQDLGDMLSDVLAAKAAGQTYARLARAHGYVDGYMRALIELDVMTRQELLAVVARARTSAGGPAVADLRADPDAARAHPGLDSRVSAA